MRTTYLDWLKSQVEYFDGPRHNSLLDKLYSIAYIPLLERDWNRYEDGIALRNEYFGGKRPDDNIIDSPCSFLEFLIALARRMNYIYAEVHEDRTQDCFWMMINNLVINFVDDIWDEECNQIIDLAVTRVVERIYDPDGNGGLFPLANPPTNQRNVEVWYQMNQYLAELMREEGRL